MRITKYIALIAILISCERFPSKSVDSVKSIPDSLEKQSEDIFADDNFAFIELDSLNEDMLTVNSPDGNSEYVPSVNKLKTEHYRFFNFMNVQGEFFDKHYFLISRQKLIGDIKPIIVHSQPDFTYLVSELFTLDKQNRKIDSLIVASWSFDNGGDDPSDRIELMKSKFSGENIMSIEWKYDRYDNGSIVTVDSMITYREIGKDGKITILKKEKLI